MAAILVEKEYLDRKEFEQLMIDPVPEEWQPGEPLPEGVVEALIGKSAALNKNDEEMPSERAPDKDKSDPRVATEPAS